MISFNLDPSWRSSSLHCVIKSSLLLNVPITPQCSWDCNWHWYLLHCLVFTRFRYFQFIRQRMTSHFLQDISHHHMHQSNSYFCLSCLLEILQNVLHQTLSVISMISASTVFVNFLCTAPDDSPYRLIISQIIISTFRRCLNSKLPLCSIFTQK